MGSERRYSSRTSDTERVRRTLRLLPDLDATVAAYAERRRLSINAAYEEILYDWAASVWEEDATNRLYGLDAAIQAPAAADNPLTRTVRSLSGAKGYAPDDVPANKTDDLRHRALNVARLAASRAGGESSRHQAALDRLAGNPAKETP